VPLLNKTLSAFQLAQSSSQLGDVVRRGTSYIAGPCLASTPVRRSSLRAVFAAPPQVDADSLPQRGPRPSLASAAPQQQHIKTEVWCRHR
jgi:hypothetical protein